MSFSKQLERKIIGKLGQISRGEITTIEAKVGSLIKRLTELDSVAGGDMNIKYIKVVRSPKNN